MSRGSPEIAASLGMVAGTVALVGTAVPVRDGATDPTALLALGGSIALVALFFGRRHGMVTRTVGGPAAVLVSLVTIGAALAATQAVGTVFDLPLVGPVPTLVVGVLGALGAGALGVGDALALPTAGIYRRAVATTVYSAIGLIGFFMIQLWALVLIVVIFFTVPGMTALEQLGTADEVAISQAATVLGFGSVAAAYLVLSGRGWQYLDVRIPPLRDVAFVVGGVIAILLTALAIGHILDLLGTDTATHGTIERGEENPELLLLMIPASILVIGPFEELLYRNVIQKGLYEYFSKAGAVVVASVPFALVHYSAYSGGSLEASLASLGVVLGLSLVLGTFYALTDNLVVPALIHGCYNAVIFYSMYVAVT